MVVSWTKQAGIYARRLAAKRHNHANLRSISLTGAAEAGSTTPPAPGSRTTPRRTLTGGPPRSWNEARTTGGPSELGIPLRRRLEAQVPPRSLDPCIPICRRAPQRAVWGPSNAGGYCFAASSVTTSADIECSAPCHADHIPAETIWAMVTRGLTVAASRPDEDMGHVKRHGAS